MCCLYKHKTFIDLLYCFCAGYNGPSGFDGWLPAFGVHVGDWEHIVVRITQPTATAPSVPLAITTPDTARTTGSSPTSVNG
jgi:hypothetical protein